MEQGIVASGRRMQDMSLEELEEQWQTVKASSPKDSHEDTKTRNSTNT